MMRYIEYQTKQCKTLRLRISPFADFHDIFHTLQVVRFPDLRANSSHIIYAILELVNNSLRAHREQENKQRIIVEFSVIRGNLIIRIEDRGGGFNPKNLPYDLSDDSSQIEINGPQFHEYREKNGYLRFGMGLYIAKRTFPSFDLHFVDDKGNKVPWNQDKVSGTRIILGFGDGYYADR
jgi:anti-sigma regulatory factor (Ser/Thr protein kinase)